MTSPPDLPGGRLTTTVIRGAGISTAGYFLTLTITLASYIALARLAGPEVFGAFAAAWIVVGVSAFLTESGMSSALIQRADRLEEAAATAVLSTLATGAGLGLLALALSPVVGLYFGSREIALLSAGLSGVLLVNAATVVPDALMLRRFSFLRRVVIDPINAAAYGIAGVVALSLGMGAWGLVIATYAAGVIRVSAVWISNRWLPQFRKASFAMWRELANYARHVALSEFLREINGIATTALVGRFLGIGTLGAYRFGWRMAEQAGAPVAASASVLFPAFARIAHDRRRLQDAFLESARLLAAVIFPVSFALLPLGEQIGVTLLGEPWREAGRVLAALAGVTLGFALAAPAGELFKAANRPDLLPRVMFIRTLGSLGLLIAFLPLGARGVAAGASIAFLLAAIYAWRNVAKILALPLQALARVLVAPAVASFGMAGVLALFVAQVASTEGRSTAVRVGWLAAELILGAIIYGALLFKLSPATVAAAREVLRRSLRAGKAVAATPAGDAKPVNDTSSAAS